MSFASILKTKSLNSGPKIETNQVICYTIELFKKPVVFDKERFDFLDECKEKVNNEVERKFSTNDEKIFQRRTAVFFEYVSGSEEDFAKPLLRDINIKLDQMRGISTEAHDDILEGQQQIKDILLNAIQSNTEQNGHQRAITDTADEDEDKDINDVPSGMN